MKKEHEPELNVEYFIDPYQTEGGGFRASIIHIDDKNVSYSTENGLSLQCPIKEWKKHMRGGIIKKA